MGVALKDIRICIVANAKKPIGKKEKTWIELQVFAILEKVIQSESGDDLIPYCVKEKGS